VKRIDEHQRAAERQAGGNGALAEPAHQRSFRLAAQARLGEPRVQCVESVLDDHADSMSPLFGYFFAINCKLAAGSRFRTGLGPRPQIRTSASSLPSRPLAGFFSSTLDLLSVGRAGWRSEETFVARVQSSSH
jgi:hypothetical protein